ncbi:MAG: MSHA biogenesis protein MshP [Vibrio litoralis]|uniref:MSHA biogenesis protein MshP n=1 Tax=Vibrio litoralis TaxID=335972 RepID=UPI003F991253
MNRMKNPRSSSNRQSGSVLIVVIFVVVVMGLLAATMARLEWSNQDTQSREIMGNRAWFMAHSANEWALTQLYLLNHQGSVPSDIEARCSGLNSADAANMLTTQFREDSEYGNCSVKALTCSTSILSADDIDYTYFKVHAEASCGDEQGLFSVERSQDVVVKALK